MRWRIMLESSSTTITGRSPSFTSTVDGGMIRRECGSYVYVCSRTGSDRHYELVVDVERGRRFSAEWIGPRTLHVSTGPRFTVREVLGFAVDRLAAARFAGMVESRCERMLDESTVPPADDVARLESYADMFIGRTSNPLDKVFDADTVEHRIESALHAVHATVDVRKSDDDAVMAFMTAALAVILAAMTVTWSGVGFVAMILVFAILVIPFLSRTGMLSVLSKWRTALVTHTRHHDAVS